MNEFIYTFNNILKNNNAKNHPILLASYAHLEFVRIHPFIDGNGRTARLIMNLELMKGGFPAISIDKERKAKYYEAVREYDLHRDTSKMDLLITSYVNERLEFLKDFFIKSRQDNNYSTKLKELESNLNEVKPSDTLNEMVGDKKHNKDSSDNVESSRDFKNNIRKNR